MTMKEQPDIHEETYSGASGSSISKREARLVRKIDIRLLPWLILIFWCAALDKYALTTS